MMKKPLLTAGLLLSRAVASLPPRPEELQWQNDGKPKTWAWSTPTVYTPAAPTANWPWGERTEEIPTPTITTPPSGPTGLNSVNSSPKVKTSDECAEVSSLQSAFLLQASPVADVAFPTATVPAELAYKCINRVPFNGSAAETHFDGASVALMESIRPFIEWQTTLQWVKDPPLEYAQKIQAPYDFWADFERIYARAKAGNYTNEYRFGFDLYRSFQKVHDGHFVIYPDSVNSIFSFGRTTPLVSVSVDGLSIPEVYAYQDVLDTIIGNATYAPSPLTHIDGEDSTEFLLNWADYGALQDRDALWNNLFYLLQSISLDRTGTGTGTFSGGGRGRWIYPGPTTNLTFANGTSVVTRNFARVLVNFDDITSGEDIYRKYFTPPANQIAPAEVLATSSTTTTLSTSTITTATIPAPGFPTPFIREHNNLNGGYFLEGEDYNDTAVLSVGSFVGQGGHDDEKPFQKINTYFIDEAVKRNKTKLIIDVSANGGGTILQGYDLFKQLFPHVLPYGASRYRAHPALDFVGQESSHFSGLVNRSLDLNDTAEFLVSSVFNYRTDDNVAYHPFLSWKEKYGPVTLGPGQDHYTNLIRWNLSDVLTPVNSGGIDVSGYLNRTNITMQPFLAENIVVVTDGYCASTCTIFSEFMRQQAGVKYISLGGRPNSDITQAVGGTKGTNDLPYSYILAAVLTPFTYRYIHPDEFYNDTELGRYNDLVLYRTVASVINSRDGYRRNGSPDIPLQFQYEPADCRIYYTPEMAVDMEAAWKTVADTAFRGINHCIAGEINHPDAPRRTKRDTVSKHSLRKDISLREHFITLSKNAVGLPGINPGGDCVMIP